MHSCHCQKWIFKISYSFYWRNIILFKSFYSYSQVFVFILSIFREKAGEGNGTPLQYSCLEGCSPWGRWGSGMTEQLHFHFSLSCTGEGNGNPLQCSCLENPRDGGAWWAAAYGVAQSGTRLKRLSSSSREKAIVQWFYFISYIQVAIYTSVRLFYQYKKLFLKFGLATYFFQLTSSCHPQLEIYTLTRN